MRTGSEIARRIKWEVLFAQDRERLKARLNKHTRVEGECVVWTGRVRKQNGYGTIKFWYKSKYVSMDVHQLFLMLMIGKPIPIGFEAGHTCTNRLCVRHLELQTYQDNLARRGAGDEDNDCPF